VYGTQQLSPEASVVIRHSSVDGEATNVSSVALVLRSEKGFTEHSG